ncbi:MAG: thermonuclease family protein [Nitratireductor sp.]
MIRAFLVALLLASPASAMPFCAGPERITCVVDGDTVWIDGEKIRLASIDAPEAGGKCFAERDLAARSAEFLRRFLEAGDPAIERSGMDRYGRTLARIWVGRAEAGEALVAAGLARPWKGHREDWCN